MDLNIKLMSIKKEMRTLGIIREIKSLMDITRGVDIITIKEN